jgi:WD40 repeat protein
VRLWDRATGKELFVLGSHGNSVTGVTFTRDGKRLVSVCEDKKVRIWDTATGKALRNLEPDPAQKIALLAPGSDPQTVRGWMVSNTILTINVETGKVVDSLTLYDQPDQLSSVIFSPDGASAAVGTRTGTVRIWDLDKKQPLPGGDWAAQTDRIVDLAVGADRKLLILGQAEGKLRIADAATRQIKHEVKAHAEPLLAMVVAPDGKTFATLGGENVVKLWDAVTGKELRSWDFQHPKPGNPFVRTVIFTPDSKQLVTGNGNGTVYLLDCP